MAASPAGISSGSGAGGWMRPDLMFSELSPSPGVNPRGRTPRSRASRLERQPQELAQLTHHPLRLGGQLLIPDGETRQRRPRLLDHIHVPQAPGHRLLHAPGFLRPPRRVERGVQRGHRGGRVAQQEDKSRVRPAGRDPFPDQHVARRLDHEPRLAAAPQRLGEHPVPEHVLQVLGGQLEAVQGGLDPLRLGADAEVLERQLRRSVQLRVAAQDDPEQRRAGPGRGKDDHRRGQQPPAVCLGRFHARPARGRDN